MSASSMICKILFLLTLLLSSSLFAAPNATLTGQITNGSAAPIQGALVQVYKGNNVKGSGISDSSGNYLISNLNPGSVNVRISAIGYETRVVGAQLKNNQTTTENVTLTLSGGAISGTVVDANTTLPIGGATVNIYQGTTLYATVVTNGSGQYNAIGLAPGSFIVVASAIGYQSAIQGAIVTDGNTTIVNFALVTPSGAIQGTVIDALTTNPIEDATVLITSGNVIIGASQTDINGNYSIPDLPPGFYVAIAFGDGYEFDSRGVEVTAGVTTTANFALIPDIGLLSGTVTNATNGSPIQGAAIQVYKDSVLVATYHTDESGNYEVPNLDPGQYSVVASAPSFQSQIKGATIVSNQTTTLNFALETNPGSITGTVIDALSLSPIGGATIVLLDGPIILATAITDLNGQYSITGIAPGSYTLRAGAQGYQTAASSIVINADETTLQNFALIPNPGSLAGIVTDAVTALPIPGATIRVFNESMLIASAITDVNGNYTILGLAPGNYVVAAGAPQYSFSIAQATIIANTTTILNFQLNANSGSIAGTVINACGNQPLPGALILVFEGNNFVTAELTDENGQYIIDGLSPGSYNLIARKTDFVLETATVNVTSGNTTTQDFVLTPIPLPPQSIHGSIQYNKFLTVKQRVNVITWAASSSGCIEGYQVFKNGAFVGFIPFNQPLVYYDTCLTSKTNTYQVRTVNRFGEVSTFITITL